MEYAELINAIRTLPSFFNTYLKGKKMEDTSVLSCVKKIKKGQEFWALFCALVNYQIKVRKFLIPMLNALLQEIEDEYNGDFIRFIKTPGVEQKSILENLKWQYINKKNEIINRTGWSHRFEKVNNLNFVVHVNFVIIKKLKLNLQ